MNSVIMHFVSGDVFYTGLALIVISILMSFHKGKVLYGIIYRLSFLGGYIFVSLSSTPVYMPLCMLLCLMPCAMMVFLHFDKFPEKLLVALRILSIAVCLTAGIAEIFNRIVPEIPRVKCERIYVVGDSVSAGIGFKGEKTWTEIVEEKTHIKVVNLSRGGGTARSAQGQAKMISGKDILIFLEIGGNDMLGRTPVNQYRQDLDELLKLLEGGKRTLVMLELPCPPLNGRINKIQRELARKHNVILIPKKVFSRIFEGKSSTVDGIHLSNQGHEKMAQAFLDICGTAVAPF